MTEISGNDDQMSDVKRFLLNMMFEQHKDAPLSSFTIYLFSTLFLHFSGELKYSTSKRTWTDAMKDCKGWGGFVVLPTNQNENNLLLRAIKSRYECRST